MDLSSPKVKDQDKLDLCKKYFLLGFGLLPFLWAINAVWFFREAFVRNAFEQQKDMKRYVILSAILAVISFVALTTWVVVFSQNRLEWGRWADDISFNIPTGGP